MKNAVKVLPAVLVSLGMASSAVSALTYDNTHLFQFNQVGNQSTPITDKCGNDKCGSDKCGSDKCGSDK